MKPTVLAAILAAGIWAPMSYFGPALAEGAAEKTPPSAAPTLLDAQALDMALKSLDGHPVVIKRNGTEETVSVPYEFGSGSLRLRIANDISIVDAGLKALDETRRGIIKEHLKPGQTEIKVGTPAFEQVQEEYRQALAAPLPRAGELSRIKASELKLDQNEIPVTVLQALKPVLDQ